MRRTLILIITACCISCINPPDKNEYLPFECSSMPETRTYFPEESIVFSFNMEINPATSEGFSAISTSSQETLPFKINGNSISVFPPLPANDTISITISSQLKSTDNKPLQINGKFSEEKENIIAEYSIGNALPEIISILPDDSKSSSVAVEFSNSVVIDSKNVEPVPETLFQIGNWYVFVFSNILNEFAIKNARPADRDLILDEIKITLSEQDPVEENSKVTFDATDTTISINIADNSAIAATVNGISAICNKKCSVFISELKPSETYSFPVEIFTKTGIKSQNLEVVTNEPAPHIMISEIMHTPANEPEKNWEFVEIYNNGSLDFDLTDCFIDDKNDGTGKDPLSPQNTEDALLLKPGEVALITGNGADFSSVVDSFLWLTVDDTTIADAGLTSNESVQIICNRNEEQITEDSFDPSAIKSERGYSVNVDTDGNVCVSEEIGGSPGRYYDCP